MSRTAPPAAPPDPQQALAAELVECLGRDGAEHVCQMNGWDGVLRILRHDRDDGRSGER